jgi:hypothetical protein
MPKLWRLFQYFWECFVIVQKDFFSFWRWVSFLIPFAMVSAPWFVNAIKQQAWWLCIIGIVLLLIRAHLGNKGGEWPNYFKSPMEMFDRDGT